MVHWSALDDLKAEDETIVNEIIALIHEVYNTDEYGAQRVHSKPFKSKHTNLERWV